MWPTLQDYITHLFASRQGSDTLATSAGSVPLLYIKSNAKDWT